MSVLFRSTEQKDNSTGHQHEVIISLCAIRVLVGTVHSGKLKTLIGVIP